VLERAFAEAIATQGVVTGTAAYVKAMVHFDRTRGWSPADVIRTLFPEDEIRAQAANLSFERSFRAAADRFGALPLPRRERCAGQADRGFPWPIWCSPRSCAWASATCVTWP
jgi:hypothetical protein